MNKQFFLQPNPGDSRYKNKNWAIKNDFLLADVYWTTLEKTFRDYRNVDTDRQIRNGKSKIYIVDTLDVILDNNSTATNIEQNEFQE